MSEYSRQIIIATVIGVVVVICIGIGIYYIPSLATSSESTTTATCPPFCATVSNTTISFSYCSNRSSAVDLSAAAQVMNTTVFQNAAGNITNWVLYGGYNDYNIQGYNGTSTMVTTHYLRLDFFTSGQEAPSALCDPSNVQLYLYVDIPIDANGSFNMAAISAYTALPYQLNTSTQTSNFSSYLTTITTVSRTTVPMGGSTYSITTGEYSGCIPPIQCYLTTITTWVTNTSVT